MQANIHLENAKGAMETKENAPADASGPDAQAHRAKRQKIVFTDPVALHYLEEDSSTVVLHRRQLLHGYETYIVEQWTCSRMHPTFLINTYTGDPTHTVVAGVLGVPTDESTWSPRLRLYFYAVKQYHARVAETPLGYIILTDLETFPSSLTVILVPDGDVDKHREDFIVNEDLKRLGCAGRAGLKLQYPPPATEAKFHLLYRTSERVPLYSAVMGLIKLCKMALMMFDKLAPQYVDGLFCDITEVAVSDWWTDIGIDLYNVEPSDGILGPTTVAALLGMLMGARNRLHAYGVPVGKDAFDITNLKRGIGAFQKSEKLRRTRRLDRTTLDRLHRATAKALNSDRWTGAVKSTVAELSGKGGEMVMGMVGGRGKGGIADIETLDMDNFSSLVTGSRAKWLWKGKPQKTGNDDGFSTAPGASDLMFTEDSQGGYVWTSRNKHSNENLRADRPVLEQPENPPSQSDMARKGVVSGKVSDARAGFDRFKGAVGLHGRRLYGHRHARGNSADEAGDTPVGQNAESESERDEWVPENHAVHDVPTRARNDDEQVESPSLPLSPKTGPATPEIHIEPVLSEREVDPSHKDPEAPPEKIPQSDDEGDESEVYGVLPSEEGNDQEQVSDQAIFLLRRSRSCEEFNQPYGWKTRDDYFPRNLSFSTVEEAIYGWQGFIVHEKPGLANIDELLATDARFVAQDISGLNQDTIPWVERQVESVEQINRNLDQRDEDLNIFSQERAKEYENVREASSALLAEEHSQLHSHARRVELLGAKLDYDIETLESKVRDFEAALEEFEQHVDGLEGRLKGLTEQDKEEESSSWLGWFGSLLTGVTGGHAGYD